MTTTTPPTTTVSEGATSDLGVDDNALGAGQERLGLLGARVVALQRRLASALQRVAPGAQADELLAAQLQGRQRLEEAEAAVSSRSQLSETELALRRRQLERLDAEREQRERRVVTLRQRRQERQGWLSEAQRFVEERRSALASLRRDVERGARLEGAPEPRQASPLETLLLGWADELGERLPEELEAFFALLLRLRRGIEELSARPSAQRAEERLLRLRGKMSASLELGAGEVLAPPRGELSWSSVELRGRRRALRWLEGEASGQKLWRRLCARLDAAAKPKVVASVELRSAVRRVDGELRARQLQRAWLRGELEGRRRLLRVVPQVARGEERA